MYVVLGLSLCGAAMGALTSLVGFGDVELVVWSAMYAVWVFVLLQRPIERPFVIFTMSSALAGLVSGATQVALYDAYRANNPEVAAQLTGDLVQDTPAFLGLGLALGLFFGVQIGALLALMQKRLARREAPPS